MIPQAEALLVQTLIKTFSLLPPATASTLAGTIAATLGPILPVSRVAHANLAAAMPELNTTARRQIVRGAWEQLGRTVGELPHIAALAQNTPSGPGWEVSGEDILACLAQRGGPVIFFSGHIGNWEILPRAANRYGLPVASFYRAAQNTRVDRMIIALREDAAGHALKLIPKGAAGARQAVGHLRGGGCLAMLVDQKLNDGIEARFFGLPAMTAPAAATFALHFRCPLVPARSERIGPARLRLVVEPPLALPDTGDRKADVAALTQSVADVLERWIRLDPASWLWLHRRWKKA